MHDHEENNLDKDSETKNDTPAQAHPAVINPSLWWKYEGSLNADLVVITPAMEGDTGLHSAGELPLAEEPRFPKARQKFLSHLHEQGSKLAQHAMLQAMTTGD